MKNRDTLNSTVLEVCSRCDKTAEFPTVFDNGEYRISRDSIHHNGRRLDVMPSCVRLLQVIACAEGMEAPIAQLAEQMRSHSRNPKNLISVLIYALRKETQGAMPINSQGGSILWTGRPFEMTCESPAVCEDCANSSIARSSTRIGQKRRIDFGRTQILLSQQEHTLISVLAAKHGKLVTSTELALAMQTTSPDHANIVKTIVCTARKAFRKSGLTAPIVTIRGKGLLWEPGELQLFAEEYIADSHPDETHERDGPVPLSESIRGDSSCAQGGQETNDGKRRAGA